MVVSVENNLFFNRKVHCPFVCVTQMPRMMFTLMMNLLQRIMPFSVLIIHLHHYLLLDRYYSLFHIAVSNFSRCLFPAHSPLLVYSSYGHILIEPWQRRWASAATAAGSLRSLLFHPRTAAILKPASCFCYVCTIHQPFNASRLALWMNFTTSCTSVPKCNVVYQTNKIVAIYQWMNRTQNK